MKNWQAAAMAISLAAMPRIAIAGDFETCDGYTAPGKTDGMTEGTWLWGLATATVDKRPTNIVLSEAGLEACDRALSDPTLTQSFSLRRAHLLQAKSLHALSVSNYDLALEVLKQSDELGKADPLFANSLGLGNRAIRAYALSDMGHKDAALQEVDKILQARPWSASIRRLTLRLRLKIDDASAASSLRNDMPLIPEDAFPLFWQSFVRGEYGSALSYAPAVSWELPKKRGGWTFDNEQQTQLEMIEGRAEFAGARGFALAVSGHQQEAAAVFQEAEDQLSEALAQPVGSEPGKPASKRDIEAWKWRTPYAQVAQNKLARWRQAVDFISNDGADSLETTLQAFSTAPIAKLPILPAIVNRAKVNSPEELNQRDKLLEAYREKVDETSKQAAAFTLLSLARALPRHQTAKMIPVLKRAGDGYFLSDTGLSRAREGDTDIWTIRFVHKYAPIEVVEEMAMFGAATTALAQGKDSVLVLSRRSANLTTRVMSYYRPIGDVASGYEAQMRVQLVNATEIPASLVGMEWRLLKAKDIVDSLSKRYRQSGGVTIAW